MKKKKSSPYKESAFSMKMDSDITSLNVIDNFLYAFSKKSIYKIETGTSRDPENTNPMAPNTKVKILGKGTDNAIVHQFADYLSGIERKSFGNIQAITFNPKVNLEEIKKMLFDLMLNCSTFEDSYASIVSSFNEQLKSIDVPKHENNFEVEAFIPNLEKQVKDVIINECGAVLNKISRLIILFYKDSLSNNSINEIMNYDKRLDNLINILLIKKIINSDNELKQIIDEGCTIFLTKLVDIRNALEHPTEKKKVILKNFHLLPNRNFVAPSLILVHPKYNEDEKNLIEELIFYCKNLIALMFSVIRTLIEQSFDSYYSSEGGTIYKWEKEVDIK